MKTDMISKTLMVLGLIAVTLLSSPASAQEWAKKMFQEMDHDFGNVPKGEVPEYRFEFQNLYEEDLHIAQVVSSCGCTSASLSKKVLKTWEKGEVVCRFNSPAFDGHKQASIRVLITKPYVGEVQLTVKGNIVRGLVFSPESIDFGQVSESNLPEREIKLTNSGGNFRIADVKSTFPHIKVQLKETARTSSMVTYTMKTQLRDSVPSGFSQGELYIVVEENKVRREVPLKFSAKVVSELQVPEMIAMGTVKPGEEVKKRVVLKSNKPFKITDVTSHSTSFRVKAGKEEKKVHFVEVIYVGEEKPGQHVSELSFYINSSTEPAGKIKAVVEIVSPDGEPDASELTPKTADVRNQDQ
jgi:hypothetical protein